MRGRDGERPARRATRRLFFALWPEADVSAELAALQRRHCASAARPVPEPGIHLTLQFLGDCDAAEEKALRTGAAAIRVPAFEVVLDRLGGLARRGLLWTEPSEVPEPLLGLASALRVLAASSGRPVETREFSAHVTLARRASVAPPGTSHEPVIWPVRSFTLTVSLPAGAGMRYEPVETWPLR